MESSGKIDTTNSNLILEGDETEQKLWNGLIEKRRNYLKEDKSERENIYRKRRDFIVGDQYKYSNIEGIQKKEKKGHANAVYNYAGKSITKIAYSLANNPPSITFPIDSIYKPDDVDYNAEEIRTQSTEDFVEMVFRFNHFWKRGYRRAVFNQVGIGDAFIKVYPINNGTKEEPNWSIKIVNQEKVENLLVGWRGDDNREFDYVIAEEDRSVQSIEEEFGIKVPASAIQTEGLKDSGGGGHANNNQWKKNSSDKLTPSGKNSVPTVKLQEYDDENIYAIRIAGELVQLIHKDGENFPKMKFWVPIENIPNPGSNWSISDVDYVMDANVELNEASNEERDLIRVGTGTKYVATNLDEFNPEDMKPGSGQVIFISSNPDNPSKLEPLSVNVNNYPADSYLTRIKKHIHDMTVPEVTFGSAGGDSGRSKAIDYQTFVDLTIFKRDAWELALIEICEKIQYLGYFLFKHEFLTDPKTGEYKYRYPQFDWTDIVPTTSSEKIVNVLNKFQMGLPFKEVYKELEYRDVDAIISEMKKEAQDPDLMAFRAKLFTLTQGIMQAQAQAQAMMPQVTENPNGTSEQPTLTSDQNTGAMPMSARGGTTSASTAEGQIATQRQNLTAAGQ